MKKKLILVCVIALGILFIGARKLGILVELPQMIAAPELKTSYYFAGEEVPMDNPDVSDRFDRELVINSYLHSTTILNLKYASRFFPMIESVLEKYNIPADFKYLVPVESNFRNAVSPAGAKGPWQFMTGTARELGLEISDCVDERYDMEKATVAACKHIQSLYDRLGNWTLVAAAYNGGGARIKRELEAQKVKDFYDLYLNSETSRYVFRVLALKEIMTHPQKYGYDLSPSTLYGPLENVQEVQVDSTISNLPDWAIAQGTTYQMIRYLNPWIIDRHLPVKQGTSYIIKIPEKNK